VGAGPVNRNGRRQRGQGNSVIGRSGGKWLGGRRSPNDPDKMSGVARAFSCGADDTVALQTLDLPVFPAERGSMP